MPVNVMQTQKRTAGWLPRSIAGHGIHFELGPTVGIDIDPDDEELAVAPLDTKLARVRAHEGAHDGVITKCGRRVGDAAKVPRETVCNEGGSLELLSQQGRERVVGNLFGLGEQGGSGGGG